MIKKVKVKDIKPNPFQHRKTMDEEALQSLADEIGKVGLWAGALRGRQSNGNIELCFGHRRLEAVRKLGWKEVDIDLVKMDDKQMSSFALIENLQREGLDDADKAEGIAAYIKLRKADKNSAMAEIIKEVGQMFGYKPGRVYEWQEIADLPEKAKKLIREKRITGKSALGAYRIAGEKGIQAAAANEKEERKALAFDTIQEIAQKIETIERPALKEKIKEQFGEGKIRSGFDVEMEVARHQRIPLEKDLPPDLMDVISRWAIQIEDWNGQLDAVLPYLDYLKRDPRVANRFRQATRDLIARLQKFLD